MVDRYQGLPEGAEIIYKGLPQGAEIVPGSPTSPQAIGITPDIAAQQIEAAQPPPEKTFSQRIGEDMKNRWEKTQMIRQAGQTPTPPGQPQDAISAIMPLFGAIAGEGLGAGFDFANEAIVSAWNVLAPDEFKEFISEKAGDFAQTKVGQKAIKALSGGMEKWNSYVKSDPVGSSSLEGLLNISSLGFSKIAAKEAKSAVTDISRITTKGIERITEGAVSEASKKRFSTAIRKAIPQIVDLAGPGKIKFKQKIKYLENAESAISDIISNKENIKLFDLNGKLMKNNLPINHKTATLDMIQAIDQTKKQIWPEVEMAMQQVKSKGIGVPTNHAVLEINKYIKDTPILSRPSFSSVIKEKDAILKRYKNMPMMTVEDAQKEIKSLNETLREMKYFATITSADKKKANLYAAELVGLKKAFRKTIGDSGSESMRRYGKLLDIEGDFEDLVHTKVAGQPGINYAATYSTLEGLRAVTGGGLHPSALGMSHVVSAISKSNRKTGKIIADMFEKADKFQIRKKIATEPLTYQGDTLKGVGAGIGTAAPLAIAGQTFEEKLQAFDNAIDVSK